MSEWISVKKYLPPFHEYVLIHIENEKYQDCNYIGYLESDGNFYFNEDTNSMDSVAGESVTHWMPIPECHHDR